MRSFAKTINARRNKLVLTYEQVYERLQAIDWPVGTKPPSLPSVGHWFNGTRRPRNMEHLKGLCRVLEMSLDEAMGESSLEAITDVEQLMLKKLRKLNPASAELLLALAEKMEKES